MRISDWSSDVCSSDLNSGAFWTEIRDVRPFVPRGGALDGRCVWKISVPPTDGPALADALTAELGGEAFLDWGGGLVWLMVEAPDAAHERIRAALLATGGDRKSTRLNSSR